MAKVGKKATRQESLLRSQGDGTIEGITIGVVVDTNDPEQMGRIRVLCPAWGDRTDAPVTSLPWAMYCSPFAGTLTCGTRGPNPEKSVTEGTVSYGTWMIPKVGAQAFVMCLDGNPMYRIWLGCLPGQFLTHTMPMGRFFSEGTEGPFASTEKTIEPLVTNIRESFGKLSEKYEGRTRGAEQQVGAITEEQLDQTVSGVSDEIGTDYRRGYQHSRIRPDVKFQSTKGNFDSQMYCITTPGLHMLLMDDSDTNGKMRFRTTAGHQIILDDTNERVYVSTAEGKNWIEMDQNGNIDIYSERRVSVHAEKDINFKTEGAFRVTASSIHLNAEGDVRSYSGNNLHLRAANNVNVCGDTTSIEGTNNLHLNSLDSRLSGGIVHIDSTSTIQFGVSGATTLSLQVFPGNGGAVPPYPFTVPSLLIKSSLLPVIYDGENSLGLDSSGSTGSNIYPVLPADPADSACGSTLYAWSANRVPDHEPWGRIMSTATDFDDSVNSSSNLELTYENANVGRVELGDTITRNTNWRR